MPRRRQEGERIRKERDRSFFEVRGRGRTGVRSAMATGEAENAAAPARIPRFYRMYGQGRISAGKGSESTEMRPGKTW